MAKASKKRGKKKPAKKSRAKKPAKRAPAKRKGSKRKPAKKSPARRKPAKRKPAKRAPAPQPVEPWPTIFAVLFVIAAALVAAWHFNGAAQAAVVVGAVSDVGAAFTAGSCGASDTSAQMTLSALPLFR